MRGLGNIKVVNRQTVNQKRSVGQIGSALLPPKVGREFVQAIFGYLDIYKYLPVAPDNPAVGIWPTGGCLNLVTFAFEDKR